jgi:Ni,Fe-hydrogenase I small subunit
MPFIKSVDTPVIDSGSGILWVTQFDCRGCNVSDAQLFDPTISHTIISTNNIFELDYVEGIALSVTYSNSI